MADVCEFYSPDGGGVKTYVHARWRAAATAGHHVDVIAPAARDRTTPVEGGSLIEVKAPRHPVDPRYHIFWRAAPVHAALDVASPELIEGSSPWRGGWLAAGYAGPQPRTLFMHEEPVQKWAYGLFDRAFSRGTIDTRIAPWLWRHLRRLYARFDRLVFAADSVAARMRSAGIDNAVTIPMGVEANTFSPAFRDPALRAELLSRMTLPETATLLIGVGRHTAEKRWPVIIDAVLRAGHHRPIGLAILGGGHAQARTRRAVAGNPHILCLDPVADRSLYARTLASADAFIHASNAETYGLAAAEAAASGLPLILPHEGAVADFADPNRTETYPSGDARAAGEAILRLCAGLPDARQAAKAAASDVPTLHTHFERLFALYEDLAASTPPR